MTAGVAGAQAEDPATAERAPLVVALDGSGQYRSIQEAVDAAKKGDTILIRPGAYPEDVTIHSKENVRLIGAGMDQVTILGRERVGVFHIGKWPYGATNIEISGITVNEHGGHAMGMFNGRGIHFHHARVKGMLFTQQVEDVRIEDCDIGGSETTGVQFANSQAVMRGNFVHDNDHGVSVAGKSTVRL
ncbi:MAG TPA: pectinesterase family protein, partial [Nitrospira sp.]|nr:pectinesterase family protein [Nitrospira sp.]